MERQCYISRDAVLPLWRGSATSPLCRGSTSPLSLTLTYGLWPWPLRYLTLTHDLSLWPWPLRPLILTDDLNLYLCDLDLDPCDLDLGPSFLILGWKLGFLHFYLGDLDLWPWPSNSSEIWWSLKFVPNCRFVGPTVQPVERKQTHWQTDATESLPLTLTWEVKTQQRTFDSKSIDHIRAFTDGQTDGQTDGWMDATSSIISMLTFHQNPNILLSVVSNESLPSSALFWLTGWYNFPA